MNLSTNSFVLSSVCLTLIACADDRDAATELNSSPVTDFVAVTLANYKVAESDLAFSKVGRFVGMNRFLHRPVNAFDLQNQTVVRMNRDTIYSAAVVNISEGATVTLPESDGRYVSIMVVQNDHYVDQVFSTPGEHVIEADTEFVLVVLRIRAHDNDPEDEEKIKALQQAARITAKSTVPHVMPNYDLEQLEALRKELAAQAAAMDSYNSMQGARGTVDERMHLLGTAVGWGLLPDANARYLWYGQQDGQGCYRATYSVPPFDEPGFFSITMYDADGWLFSDRAVLNEHNLEFNEDGTFDVNFGDCGVDAKNNLPIVDGWNFVLRVYEPRSEELDRYSLPAPLKVT